MAATMKRQTVKFIERGGMNGPINWAWPSYLFYEGLGLIHRHLPCGSYKDKDILVPTNFQFRDENYYSRIASFDVAVMRFCERSRDNPTKGDDPIWRIYPILSNEKLIGFDYEPINRDCST